MREKFPLAIPPGVVIGDSPSTTPGRWRDSQLVRWVGPTLRPVGGWARLAAPSVAPTIRSIHMWTDNGGISRVAVLCEYHVYVIEQGELIDISPTPALQGPFSDFQAGGFGAGKYNQGTFGSPRPQRITSRLLGPAWTLETFGEDLLIMSSFDGRLLRWKVGDASCAAVPNAPIGNRLFVVTPERHIILFGAGGDSRHFQWCSSENAEDWDLTSVTNTAGDYDVEPASPIIAAKSGKYGVVFWTASKTYLIRYAGVPYIYTYKEIGDESTPFTASCVVGYSDVFVWASKSGFWSFNGGSPVSMPCDFADWFKNDQSPDFMRYRAAAMVVNDFQEVWWFYPSIGSNENNKYVVYNWEKGWWSKGILSRSCGYQSSYFTNPYMAQGTEIYVHEFGNRHDGAPLPFATTSSLTLPPGSNQISLLQGLVDVGAQVQNVRFDFASFGSRNLVVANEKANLAPRVDGYLDIGITGRDIRMTVRAAVDDILPWHFGEMLMWYAPRGAR